jgi:ABC-type glycerol-3-phosphate transport system permease component
MTDRVQTISASAPARRITRAPGRRFRFSLADILTYVVLTAGAIVVMLPFLWMLSSSFKPAGDILVYPPQLIPQRLTFDNYNYVLYQTRFLTFVRNSLIIVAFTITGHVVSGSLVAYGFARFRFPARNTLFLILLGTLMIPFHAYMIPRFFIMKELGVLDSLTAVFLPYLFGGPLYIFLLRQFFMSIPRELDDAARIDGCNSFQVFWRILFPLARPAIVTVAVLEFLAAWTSFLEPLIYLNSQENYTVALGLSLFRQGFGGAVDWGPLMAATAMSALAPLVVFFIAQKQLMGGIASIGLKG